MKKMITVFAIVIGMQTSISVAAELTDAQTNMLDIILNVEHMLFHCDNLTAGSQYIYMKPAGRVVHGLSTSEFAGDSRASNIFRKMKKEHQKHINRNKAIYCQVALMLYGSTGSVAKDLIAEK